jgi:UDP-N-acetylmuramoylalanine--D-glutamate ligase
MSALPQDLRHAVVVGLGKTGLSAVRYLRANGVAVSVTDSRAEPPGLAELRAFDQRIPVRCGGFDSSLLAEAQLVVISPGVAARGEFFDAARARGLPVVGDIELFARAATAPVAGITGTNGKSTVTTLLGRMAERAGCRVRTGGNLGEPALTLLDPQAQLYVLELSSYQLESTDSLQLAAAAVLNVSPDHLDRYADTEQYAAAKARIFRRCGTAIVNADDARVRAMVGAEQRQLRFSLQPGAPVEFGLIEQGGTLYLARDGQPLLAAKELKMPGRHNLANALAALALGEALGLPAAALLAELREFTGLAHRTQWIADVAGVRYIDDSKGTNVGATIAAVAGLPGPLLLIAGGDGKGQDFAPLRDALQAKVRYALLIGRDARLLGQVLEGTCTIEYCASLEAAVLAAARVARRGDTVLLSPACASLDMFRDYTHRGAVFAAAVRGLSA